MNASLKDIKRPAAKPIDLLRGRVAIVGPVTIETMCWAEEKFGSLDAVLLKLKDPDGGMKIGLLSEFIFNLIENRDDFKDLHDFRSCIPMESILEMMNVLTAQIDSSMVKIPAVKKPDGAAIDAEVVDEKKP
jgi:hypothetical protein